MCLGICTCRSFNLVIPLNIFGITSFRVLVTVVVTDAVVLSKVFTAAMTEIGALEEVTDTGAPA